jgi:hypothetical protein
MTWSVTMARREQIFGPTLTRTGVYLSMHGYDRRSSVNPLTLALQSAPFPPQSRIFLELLLCQTRLFALYSGNCSVLVEQDLLAFQKAHTLFV